MIIPGFNNSGYMVFCLRWMLRMRKNLKTRYESRNHVVCSCSAMRWTHNVELEIFGKVMSSRICWSWWTLTSPIWKDSTHFPKPLLGVCMFNENEIIYPFKRNGLLIHIKVSKTSHWLFQAVVSLFHQNVQHFFVNTLSLINKQTTGSFVGLIVSMLR